MAQGQQKGKKGKTLVKPSYSILLTLSLLTACGEPRQEHRKLVHRGDPLPSAQTDSENFRERFDGPGAHSEPREQPQADVPCPDKTFRICNEATCLFINKLTITIEGKGEAKLDDLIKTFQEKVKQGQEGKDSSAKDRETSLDDLLNASQVYLSKLQPEPTDSDDKAKFLAALVNYFDFMKAELPDACFDTNVEEIAAKCISKFYTLSLNLFASLGVTP